MDSKNIAFVSVFTALTIVLNLSPLKIPAPFAPYLYYQVWEIPIVAAFLLFSPLMGMAVAVLNTTVLLLIFPGALPTGPLYNLAAILGMLIGIYAIIKFSAKVTTDRKETVVPIFSTAIGILSRVFVMSFVNWAFLRYPPPIGFSFSEQAISLVLPIIAVFNATLALYTIPLGFILARAVSSRTKLEFKKNNR
jgi:riboflavin transporter FmnP